MAIVNDKDVKRMKFICLGVFLFSSYFLLADRRGWVNREIQISEVAGNQLNKEESL